MPDIVWVDPSGSEFPFDQSRGVTVTRGISGRGMPPVVNVADQVAGLDGSRPRLSRAHDREVVLPLAFIGEGWLGQVRELATMLDPRRGDGKLRVTSGGVTRELVCRYSQGLELVEELPHIQRAPLVFVGHDPLWRDVTPTVRLVDIAALAFLKDPWFDWSLVGSTALGRFVIDNDGDDVAWPVWIVQGPGGPVTLTNDTTGEVIEVDVSLAAGEQLRIDTRPGAKTVVGPADENLYPQLSDRSVLWPLVRGAQTVTVTLPDAEAGVSNVRLEYRRRWLSV